MSSVPRYTVKRFDHETVQVIDTMDNVEFAVCSEIEEQSAAPEDRAQLIADALNRTTTEAKR